MRRSDSFDDLEDDRQRLLNDEPVTDLQRNEPIDTVEHIRREGEAEFTFRAVAAGLFIGTLVCVSNCCRLTLTIELLLLTRAKTLGCNQDGYQ